MESAVSSIVSFHALYSRECILKDLERFKLPLDVCVGSSTDNREVHGRWAINSAILVEYMRFATM